MWRQRFAGLLPEVYRRHLYQRRGFSSIHEFAAKLAGMNEEQVSTLLNLEKRFHDKPILKNMLVSGEVSVHKLARVASVATVENQDFLAAQVENLPKHALDTLVKDMRLVSGELPDVKNQSSFLPGQELKTKFELVQSSEAADLSRLIALGIENDVVNEFLELKQKGFDLNALLREFLEKRKIEIMEEKEKLAAGIGGAVKPAGRYIPAKIRKILQTEHGVKCSIKTCNKPSREIHHTQRFALGRDHDPHYLAPLCWEHHLIAHSIDVKVHEKRLEFMRDRGS